MQLARHLKATLAASQAFLRLAVPPGPGGEDETAATAAQGLLEATCSEAGMRAVVSALSGTPSAPQLLLDLVKVGHIP